MSNGVHSIIAGSGSAGYSGDGGAATSTLNNPVGVTCDLSGNVFIADKDNHCIRRDTRKWWCNNNDNWSNNTAAYSGDGGPLFPLD